MSLSWRELDLAARSLAAALAERGLAGERALLLYPPGLDFIKAFFGCLYAGVVAVPAYPPGSKRSLPRLASIVGDVRPAVVLTTSERLTGLKRLASSVTGGASEPLWLTSDEQHAPAEAWRRPALDGDSLAFLQYTSGSTSAPKGVKVTHANLLHNSEMIHRGFATSAASVIVGWLPLFHDMGLIGNMLQPLYVGARCVLMSPMSFLSRPRRWLEAVTRHRATTSGGPDFAYELCVRKVPAEQREGLDLSSWDVAFNGAEPVRPATLERFAAAFAPCGFRRRSFQPCYGLAEATLVVSVGDPGRGPRVRAFEAEALARLRAVATPEGGAEPSRGLVGSGQVWMGQEVLIVDPESRRRCGPGEVGEIWVSGASVARGYWQKPEVNAREFHARLAGEPAGADFLRTGDLGFFDDGELFVAGRSKDLVILRGRNHYPQDIEQTVEQAHRALRVGCAAAFSVEVDGEEQLVVVAELERRPRADVEAVGEAVRRAVAEVHEVQVREVVLLRTGTLPKTSSGKVQRHACRQGYLEESLATVGRTSLSEAEGPRSSEDVASRESLSQLDLEDRHRRLLEELAREVDRASRMPRASRPDPEVPLIAFGLDSLAAVELTQRLEDRFGVAVPAVDVLAGLTLGELARNLARGLEEGSASSETAVVSGGSAERDAPLSFGQKAMWFLDRLSPASGAYHIAGAARVRPAFDIAALRRALTALAERHAALRTVFYERDGEPLRRVSDGLVPELRVEDAASWSGAELDERTALAAYRPFDLSAGPLLRLVVFRRSQSEDTVLLAVHHIIADFWSLAVLLRELGALYGEQAGAPPAALEALAPSYGEYVRWQREVMDSAEGERLWTYWRRQLAAPPRLQLPTDRPRPAVQTHRGGVSNLTLRAVVRERLEALASAHGATAFMVLLAAFEALLSRYSGQRDLVVGAPTTGRDRPEFAGLLGYFVNPVVLRGDLTGNPSFNTLLERVRGTALAAFEHRGMPFPLLAQRLRPERDASRSPVFQVMLVWQQAPPAALRGMTALALGRPGGELDFGGMRLAPVPFEERVSQFDLTLRLAEVQGDLAVSLQYNSDLFDGVTARRVAEHFRRLLSAAVEDPGRRLETLPWLTPAETAQLAEWNDTVRPAAPPAATIPDLLEAQARRTPERVAVSFGGAELTYGALDARANALARHLQGLGVAPEVRVAICVERSLAMVVGLWGILKAGGAYVPLDPAYPRERLSYMLEDSGAAVLVTQEAQVALADEHRGSVVLLDAAGAAGSASAASPPPLAAAGANLAYVIYTSGSTGRPKGVAIAHRSAVELLRWARGVFAAEELSGVLGSTSICFDLSVFELMVPLSWGGRVILADNALELPRLASAEDVTLLNTVPSAMAELAKDPLPAKLTTVSLAGEALEPSLVARIYAHPQVSRVLNLYGPSEDTTYSTWTAVDRGSSRVTVGRPLSSTRSYVLDQGLRAVPVGVWGEFFLGGAGLARGYLGRAGGTAERFLADPFTAEPGARMYRTGDLSRYLSTGEIEYLGRIDHQVKVRGFRIEPGEIEVALARHPEVAAAVVTAPTEAGGQRRLVAFVVGDGRVPPTGELRSFLAARLPAHLVPSLIVELASLPLTPSGKVDRRALRAVCSDDGALLREGLGGAPVTGEYRSPVEELVAGIFAEVLGLSRVGPEESFFELGGHSLLATQVVSRLRAAFGVELILRELFVAPTVRALAAIVEGAMGRGGAAATPPLVAVARDAELPLSFAQQRLWFLDQLEPQSSGYNIPAALHLVGELDRAALQASLDAVSARHEALRTRFEERGGEPVQCIDARQSCPLPRVDLRALPPAARDPELRRRAGAEARRPFDLGRGPLLRTTVLELGDAEHVLLLTMHHIVSDGWSLGVLQREIEAFYRAFAAGRPAAGTASLLPALAVQYADFAHWQRRWLSGAVLEEQLAYWRDQLRPSLTALDLPTDRPRPAVQTLRGGTRHLELPAELTGDLKALARRQGATLFMVLLAAFDILLQSYSGRRDLVVGSPVAGRNRLEVEGLIGFFVNVLVLRVDLAGDPPFTELLERVREVALEAYAHQDLPFERLVEELQPERNLARSALFQVMLVLQNAPLKPIELPGLAMRPLELTSESAQFDLSLTWNEIPFGEADSGAGGLTGALTYSRDLWDPTTMDRLLGHFRRLVEGMVGAPRQRLSELPLLAPPEAWQLLGEWQAPARESESSAVLLHELVEAQAVRTPESVAVVRESSLLSYGELDARAKRLARLLRQLGVGPEVVVGVGMERSPELVVGLLGVLEAGGVYLPLDPADPAERLAMLMEDSGLDVLLTGAPEAAGSVFSRTAPPVPLRLPAATVRLGTDGEAHCEGVRLPAAPRGPVRPADLAYVIYTSGSTGRPKGVGVSHRAAVEHMRSAARELELLGDDAVLQFGAPIFDPAVEQIFCTLSSGARLVLRGAELWEPAEFLDQAASLGLTVADIPTAYWHQVVREAAGGGVGCPEHRLRLMIVGGEAMPPEAARLWRRSRLSRVAVWNVYGPTEAVISATLHRLRRDPEPVVSIGRPLAGREVYLLDARGCPVPPGVPGELHLGGESLARGYLRQPGRAAASFVPHPLGRRPGGRLYRTGDLCRFLADGRLDFLGRIDLQVKVRGFRIEPGEIETALSHHPGVLEAKVVTHAQPSGDARLVAYVVAREASLTVAELRGALRRGLPAYMVPGTFVFLDDLPWTSTGKTDRVALARRPLPASDGMSEAVGPAPRRPTEELLAQIWGEVLGLAWVGVDESFFELGGHSLLLTRVASRLRQVFDVELPLRDLFELPTLTALARHVDSLRGSRRSTEPIRPVSSAAERELSFGQERLWFLHQVEPDSAAYNVPAALRLRGDLDAVLMARSFAEAMRRHDVLRSRFPAVAGRPVLKIDRRSELALPQVDLEGLPQARRQTELERLAIGQARRAFELDRGPLLRVVLVRLDREDFALLIAMHHIVSDGWSTGVLTREVASCYRAFSEGRPPPLPELPIQYADWGHWQRRQLLGETLSAQLTYWQRQLGDLPPVLELPTDQPLKAASGPRGARLPLDFPGGLPEELRALGRSAGATLFMTLLAAYKVLLYSYSGQEDVAVGSPVANRQPQGTEGLIGFFVNTLVLRSSLSGDPTFRELLARIRGVALDAYTHQDVPFGRIVESLRPDRNLERSPLFRVWFVLHQEEPVELDLPGLEVSALEAFSGDVRHDLMLELWVAPGALKGRLEYRTDLFSEAAVVRMAERFGDLLRTVVRQPEVRLSGLREALAKSERHRRRERGAEFKKARGAGLQSLRRRVAV